MRIIKSAQCLSFLFLAAAAHAAEPGFETLICHRGESVDAPENTLPAYRLAVERGFGFECDIYLSKDKKLFTFHDSNLKRTTGGANTCRCTDADWADTFSKVNVGGWGKWKGSKFDPTRPALLSEVLDLARGGRWIYVEVKGDDPTWVPYIKDEFARAKKANPGNVLFISFGEKVCAALKRQMPEYRVYFLTCPTKKGPDGKNISRSSAEVIAKLRELGVDGVDIRYDPKEIDAAYVKAIKDAGFSFHVWTVDSPKLARQAFAVGADTLTTNRAKFINDVLLSSGDETKSIRFASWNVGHFSNGVSGRSRITADCVPKSLERFRATLKAADADVVGVAEYTPFFDAEGKLPTAVALFGDFRHRVLGYDNGHFNSLFIRSGDLVDSARVNYRTHHQLTHYTMARVRIGGRTVALAMTHLEANLKSNPRAKEMRAAQMREVIAALKDEPFAVVAGDFNVLDQDEFRPFLDAGYAAANHGTPTWPTPGAWKGATPREAIDNIFARGFTISDFRVLNSPMMADHCLVRCTLDFVRSSPAGAN